MRQLAIVSTLVLLATTAAQTRAQAPGVDDLLARVTDYVIAYHRALTGIVSEETYSQAWYRRPDRMPETRSLRADVLLTPAPNGKRYLMFRDVFEVDGREVRDRDQRLEQLFLEPSPSTSTQALRIIEESARYNIGDMSRTVNTPTLALVFLDPQYRERFVFERSDDPVPETVRSLAGSADASAARFQASADLLVLSYREIGRDTLIGTGNGTGLRASGRFWVEPATGRVLMSELQLRDELIEAVIDVRYGDAAAVEVLVPTAMRERYRNLRRNTLIEGSATYSRVRRFQVNSTEAVAEPAIQR